MGYYSGDPGFFSLLRRAGSFAASIAAPHIPGGTLALKAISKVSAVRAAAGTAMRVTRGAIIKHPVLSAAGAAGAIGAGALVQHRGAAADRVVMGPGGVMMHMRRHRRMRVTNPKALRRALRRAHGFARLAMKTIHLIHPRKKVRFGGFRKRKSHK